MKCRTLPSIRAASWLGAVVAAGVVIGAAVIWQTRPLPQQAQTGTDAVLAMPTGPVVAVLPFANMSGDTAQDYFSDGLTECQNDKAKEAWQVCLRTDPKFSVKTVSDIMHLWNFPEPFIAKFLAGFEKAGYTPSN